MLNQFEGYKPTNSTITENGVIFFLYRKIVKDDDGNVVKGLWAVAPSHYGEILENEMFSITYNQARGFEPIAKAGEMSKKLGALLLPKI